MVNSRNTAYRIITRHSPKRNLFSGTGGTCPKEKQAAEKRAEDSIKQAKNMASKSKEIMGACLGTGS